jgi:hypothetical protein
MKLPNGSFFFGEIMSYDVGQVIYLLNNDNLTIVPVLVVEEVVRKTLVEQTKQHVVALPSEEKKQNIVLETLSESVFSDIDELRSHMLENTRKSIEKLIQNAIDKKDIFFNETALDTSKIDMNVKQDVKHEKRVQKDIKQVIMNSEDNKDTNKKDKGGK